MLRVGQVGVSRCRVVEGEEEIHLQGRFVFECGGSVHTDCMLVIAGCFIIPQSLYPDAAVLQDIGIIPDHAGMKFHKTEIARVGCAVGQLQYAAFVNAVAAAGIQGIILEAGLRNLGIGHYRANQKKE